MLMILIENYYIFIDIYLFIFYFASLVPRGPLNWYRNVERNWRWMCSRPRGKVIITPDYYKLHLNIITHYT